MKVIIDGIEYVPKTEIPTPSDAAIESCVRELVGIQYFTGQTHKHRANAWDALNAIAPNIARMCSRDAAAVWHSMNPD